MDFLLMSAEGSTLQCLEFWKPSQEECQREGIMISLSWNQYKSTAACPVLHVRPEVLVVDRAF
jgi:hypothetical protein